MIPGYDATVRWSIGAFNAQGQPDAMVAGGKLYLPDDSGRLVESREWTWLAALVEAYRNPGRRPS